MSKGTGTVLCTSTHAIDLADGRTVGPGEVVEKVDTNDPHVRDLVLSGHLYVQEGTTPRTPATFEQAVKARTPEPDSTEGDATNAAPAIKEV